MALVEKLLYRQNRTQQSSRQEDCRPANGTDDGYLIDEKKPSPTAIIYRSELDYLSRCVLDYPNIETGGQLFGFWTNQGVPVVMYVIGPGRNANHQPTFFNQDSDYLLTVGNALLDKFGLCHIGEWHSHHQLGLARPSGHDARTMHHGLARIPQRRLLLCICNYENGRSTVNPYNFHENDMTGYVDAKWQVIDIQSPFRKLADRELADVLIHPATAEPRHGNNHILETSPAHSDRPMIKIPASYWISKEGNLEILKQMLEYTQTMFASADVKTQVDENGIVQFHVAGRAIDIRFDKDFPRTAPEIYMRRSRVSPDIEWDVPEQDKGIFDSYVNWMNNLFKMVK